MDATATQILATAREAIERGERVLTRQREVIARRVAAGRPDLASIELLLRFEATQARHLAAFKRLLVRWGGQTLTPGIT